jgi:magnesium transporter
MLVFTADSDPQEIERAVAAGEPFWLDVPEDKLDLGGAAARAVRVDADRLRRFALRGQRPAAVAEGGYAALVFAGTTREPDGNVTRVDTMVFVGPHGFVTLRDKPCPQLDELREQVQEGTRHVDALLVLDVLTESLLAVADEIGSDVDGVEDRILAAAPEDMLEGLRFLRRELSVPLRLARSQHLLVSTAGDELAEVPGIVGNAERRVRDLTGHLALASDRAESTRQAIGEALDLSLSITSNRLGAAAERLSAIATVVLPATVVTGFFGMNFLWMTNHIQSLSSFLILGVGGVILSVVGALLYVRVRHLD